MGSTVTPHFDTAEDLAELSTTLRPLLAEAAYEPKPQVVNKPTPKRFIYHQESKADYPASMVYPPLDPGLPQPTKPEYEYSDEDVDNEDSVIRAEDDQYTFVALLE